MASTYTTRLRLEKQGDGENPNSWGDILNQNVIDLIDEAIAGYVVVSVSSVPVALSENNGSVDQSRNASLEFAGTLTANVTITIPSHEKTYFLRNVVTGSFDVYMKTASGSSYTVPKQNTFVACDGTNIHQIDFPTSISAFTVNQLTVVSAVSGTNATFSNGTFSTGTFSTNISTPRVSATTSLAIATSGVDRINVDSSGNVGFGTSVPIKQLEITKSARAHIVSLTDVSTSIAIDFNVAQNFAIQLVGNRTFENPSNCAAGQTGSIFIEQNVSGGKTLSFGSNWKFANGEAPTLTTTASAVDRLDYIVYTSTAIHAVVTYDVK